MHRNSEEKSTEKTNKKNDSVAQLVEQMTLNHWVVGSSPTGVTERGKSIDLPLFVLFISDQ